MTAERPIPALHPPAVLLAAVAITAALQVALLVWLDSPVYEGGLLGPDSYMRTLRVMHLHDVGRWYDAFDPRTNAPYGETLHWTRQLDALLYAGAWLGSFWVPFREALYGWSVAFGPAVLIATLFAWSWTSRPVLGSGAFLLSAALIFECGKILFDIRPGRADHHGLLLIYMILQLGAAIRTATGADGRRMAVASGVAGGLAVWVSVEAMLSVALFGAIFAARWIRDGGTDRLRATAFYAYALLATLTVALALERPPADWLLAANARLSVSYWTLAALVAALLAVVSAFAGRAGATGARRLVCAALVVAGATGGMALLFPGFFRGPWGDYDLAEVRPWIVTIGEMQPLLPTDRAGTAHFLFFMGPSLIAVAYLCLRLPRARQPERDVLTVVALGLLLYLPLALAERRWANYAEILSLLPWVLAVEAAFQAHWRTSLRALRLVAVAALLCAPLAGFAATLRLWPETAQPAAAEGGACDWTGLARHLAETAGPAGRRGIVLASNIFSGPEIVWRSGYRVVAAPYGNAESLHDYFGFFRATAESAARAIAARRGVDLVAVCPSQSEHRLMQASEGLALFDRLADGHPPAWLRPVTLPETLAPMRLYRVEHAPGAEG